MTIKWRNLKAHAALSFSGIRIKCDAAFSSFAGEILRQPGLFNVREKIVNILTFLLRGPCPTHIPLRRYAIKRHHFHLVALFQNENLHHPHHHHHHHYHLELSLPAVLSLSLLLQLLIVPYPWLPSRLLPSLVVEGGIILIMRTKIMMMMMAQMEMKTLFFH